MRLTLRRLAAIVLTMALVVSFQALSAEPAKAQTNAPGNWQSSINLQNVGTSSATPTITFYNTSGTAITTFTPSAAIAANKSLSIFVPSQITTLTAGQYSAVVSSTEPFLVSVNTASTNSATAPWTAFAYEGASEGSTTLYMPGLYKSYYNFESEMVIQNAGTASATLTAKFYNRSGTQIATASLGTVSPNASKTVSISSLTATPALPSGTSGIFGAVVTSSEGNIPLVGIVNIWRSQPTPGTASYNAFAAGSSTLYAPGLYNNYYGFASALTIQNVSTSDAAGTITYGNGTTVSFTLKPFASQDYYQPSNTALPSGNQNGIFSAKVTTTSGSIVGIVSISVPEGGVGSFASYITPSEATSQVNIPNLMRDYYGYFSAVTVQNTGTTATDITITFATGETKTYTNIGANKTVNMIQLVNQTPIAAKSAISAVVSSSNGNGLVAVIQHNTADGVTGYDSSKSVGDYLLALTGTPK